MAMLFAVAVPAIGADGSTAFTGHWQVAGVAVPDAGIQALTNNDPSLMGKRLTFTPQRLNWDQPTSTNDVCMGPTFTRLSTRPPVDLLPQLRKLGMRQPVAYTLRCRSGSWGPGDQTNVYLGAAGSIAMPWYDNGVLRLIR
ncbi:hypothetical protein [Lichenibacterium dinghuense]|uniref:hypothetical protein n=1 Tax=Lichenibacterium dinghuense TaxID=2895977 RepID=UPI001F3491B5|nr:hypothetical protein [Lichenibacterium sp. 6Y81]